MTTNDRIERLAARLSAQEESISELKDMMSQLLKRDAAPEGGERDCGAECDCCCDGSPERPLSDRERALEEILENFDYEKVVQVCNFLGWKVAGRKSEKTGELEPITITEEWLRKDTIRKAYDAWNAFDRHEAEEEWMVHSGPLRLWWCESDEGIFAELTFICEDWRVEPV